MRELAGQRGAPSVGGAALTLPAETTAAEPSTARVGLLPLIGVFLQFGALPLGGKPFPYWFDVLVRRRGWVSAEDFLEGQTLARMLPGAAGSNMIAFLTQVVRRPGSTAACVLAYVLPGALVVLALTMLVFGVERPPWVQGGMQGLAAAGLALLFVNLVQAMPSGRGIRLAGPIGVLACLGNGVLGLDLVPVLASLTLVSLACNRPRRS